MLLLGLYLSVYQTVISNITDAMGFDSMMTGLLVALYFLGALLMPLVAGEISDRIGKKIVLLASSAVVVIGILIVAASSNIILICIGVFFTGAGNCTLEGIFSSKIADRYPDESEKIMNYSQMFFCIGAVLGPMLSLLVRTSGGAWKTSMYIAASLFLLAGVAVSQLPDDRNEISTAGKKNTAYSFALLKDIRCILLFISMFLYVGGESGLAFFTMDYYAETAASASGEISLSLFWGSMVIGRLIAGILHRHSNKIMILGLAAATIFSALLQLNTSALVSIILFFLTGLGMSAIWPLIMANCTRTFSSYSGTAGGLMMAGGALGGMVVPFLMGLLSGHSVRTAILVVPAAMIISLFLSLPILRKKNQ